MRNEDTGCRRIEMKIFTHLSGDLYPRQRGGEKSYPEGDGRTLDGRELVRYEEAIRKAVNRENRPEFEGGAPCNLMDGAFWGSQSIKEKAEHAVVSVENMDGILFGCTTLQLKEYLKSWELKEMCEYIWGQYSEGWGEGFGQRDIQVKDGILNVDFLPLRNIKSPMPGIRKTQEKRIQQFIDDDGYTFYFQYKEFIKPPENRKKNEIEGKGRNFPEADNGRKSEKMLTVSEYIKMKSANKNKAGKERRRKENICR